MISTIEINYHDNHQLLSIITIIDIMVLTLDNFLDNYHSWYIIIVGINDN